jgi:hypothetical protein
MVQNYLIIPVLSSEHIRNGAEVPYHPCLVYGAYPQWRKRFRTLLKLAAICKFPQFDARDSARGQMSAALRGVLQRFFLSTFCARILSRLSMPFLVLVEKLTI